MSSKILLTGAAALAFTTALVTAGPAPAQNWQGNRGNVAADAAVVPAAHFIGRASAPETSPSWAMGYYYKGHYPGYAYVPGYNYAPPYGYRGANDGGPWSYRGGPHPR
jgi:hypothetical protein